MASRPRIVPASTTAAHVTPLEADALELVRRSAPSAVPMHYLVGALDTVDAATVGRAVGRLQRAGLVTVTTRLATGVAWVYLTPKGARPCRCCGEERPAAGRTLGARCLTAGCLAGDRCNRTLDEEAIR